MSSPPRSPTPTAVRAVILDWAGTTVDYGSFAPVAVFQRLFADRGVDVAVEDIRPGMGLMKKDHLRTILERPGVKEAWAAVHGAPPLDTLTEELFGDFVELQAQVLGEYADPIPGLEQVVTELRSRGIRIGSTTGYTRAMMAVLAPAAARHGYEPDCIVCPDEVPRGRPEPWMCFQNMERLGVYPPSAVVKVGDTLADIGEGRNAGMWSVGLSQTGNLLGLRPSEASALPSAQLHAALVSIAQQLYDAGAHLVIHGIWDLPNALTEIDQRLTQGQRP